MRCSSGVVTAVAVERHWSTVATTAAEQAADKTRSVCHNRQGRERRPPVWCPGLSGEGGGRSEGYTYQVKGNSLFASCGDRTHATYVS